MAVFYKIWDFIQNLKKNAAQIDKSSEDLNNQPRQHGHSGTLVPPL